MPDIEQNSAPRQAMDEAVRLCEIGLSAVPVHNPVFHDRTLTGCSCGAPLTASIHKKDSKAVGKHPATPRGVHGAFTTADEVDRLWPPSISNIGVPMGKVVGGYRVWALDADSPAAVHRLQELGLVQHTRSGRDDECGHFLVRVALGRRPSLQAEDLNVIGPGLYIVWPPSVHRFGRPYQVLTPIGGLEELPVLSESHTQPFSEDRDELQLRHRLGPRPSLALLHGVLVDGTANPSQIFQSALMGMLQAGWSLEEAYEDLSDEDAALPGGASLRQRVAKLGEAKALEWFQISVRAAEKYIQENPPARSREDAIREIDAARRWCTATGWSRRPSARVLLLRFLDLCESLGSVHAVGWSCRDAADACGLGSWETARDNLRYLERRGIIRRLDLSERQSARQSEHRGLLPNHFDLTVPPFANDIEQAAWMDTDATREIAHSPLTMGGMGMGVVPRTNLLGLDVLIAHDLFRAASRTCKGLGKTKAYILDCLTEDAPTSLAQIAELMHYKSVSSAREHLGALAELGLATMTQAGWYRCAFDVAKLDELAEQRGTHGRGEAVRRKHANQRRRNAEALKARTPEARATRFVRSLLCESPGVITTFFDIARAHRRTATANGWGIIADGALTQIVIEACPNVIVEWRPGPLRIANRFIGVDIVSPLGRLQR